MPTKIRSVEIEWNERYANSPEFRIEIEPEDTNEFIFEEKNNFFLGQKKDSDVVQYFYHDGRPEKQSGFGGSKFTLKMKDGSTKFLYGPWASRAACVNDVFPECKVVDIIVGKHTSGVIKANALIEFCKNNGIESAWIEDKGEIKFEPLRDGKTKRSGDRIIEVIA